MTEVPGTDRDEARKNALTDTPITPDGVEGAEDVPAGDEGQTGDGAKPEPGSTELGA